MEQTSFVYLMLPFVEEPHRVDGQCNQRSPAPLGAVPLLEGSAPVFPALFISLASSVQRMLPGTGWRPVPLCACL